MAMTLLLLALLAQAPAAADAQWPGLWGAGRDATVAAAAPEGTAGMAPLWQVPVEGGYSEVAVSGGLAVTLAKLGADDFVLALDAATGLERWRVRIGPTYEGHGGSNDGPISTPAVDGGAVFALGPHGQLIAADAATGRERWRHDLVADYGATAPQWGFAASPLVQGALVIVPTGGPGSRGLLAFERETGRLAWSAPVAKDTAYASAVAATIGGVRQIVAAAGDIVYGVDARDGRRLWSAPSVGGRSELANSPMLLPDGRVLVGGWDQSLMLQVSRDAGAFTVREVWRSPRLRGSNGPVVHRDGFLYGFAGPQLICMDAATAEVRWRERTGAGTLIAMGDTLAVLGNGTGELQFVRMIPDRFELLLRQRVLEPDVRAVTGPSYAEGRLYVRNLTQIVALDLEPAR